MRLVFLAIGCVRIGLPTCLAGESRGAVIDVGDRKQLLLDSTLIATSRGVHLTMNPPTQTTECLVTTDQPWETSSGALVWSYNTVRKEDGRIRLWYHLITLKKDTMGRDPQAAGECVAYAESTDGLRFAKPILGLHEFAGSRQNNVVLPTCRGAAVWVDPQAPPSHRYRTQTKGAKGLLTFHHSPDGIRWEQTRALSIGDCDTQSLVFWDDPIRRYVLYTRTWVRHPDRRKNYRCHRRMESDDLVHWDGEVIVMKADSVDLGTYSTPTGQPPVDYYGACVFKYPDAQGVYIMLAQAFWHAFDRTPANELGPDRMDVRLAVSRDGQRFDRVGGRMPFLRLGPEGSWYSRTIWAIPEPIRMGDELWVYFCGANLDHTGYPLSLIHI